MIQVIKYSTYDSNNPENSDTESTNNDIFDNIFGNDANKYNKSRNKKENNEKIL